MKSELQHLSQPGSIKRELSVKAKRDTMNVDTNLVIKTESIDEESEINTCTSCRLQNQSELTGNDGATMKITKKFTDFENGTRRRQSNFLRSQRKNRVVEAASKNDEGRRMRQLELTQQQREQFVIKFEPLKNDNNHNVRVTKHCHCQRVAKPERTRNLFSAVVRLERLNDSIVSKLLSGRRFGSSDLLSSKSTAHVNSKPVSGAVDIKSKPVSDPVVRLERLDDDIVTTLMPGRRAQSSLSPSVCICEDIKSEPFFSEENFCRRPTAQSENTARRKRRQEWDAGSTKKKKRRELELIRTDCVQAGHPVWLRTSQEGLIRCFPHLISTDSQSSKLSSEDYISSTRDSLLKENVDCLQGSSFPTFSGYVPSGRKLGHSQKPEQPSNHSVLCQEVFQHCRQPVHPKKNKQKTNIFYSHSQSTSSNDQEASTVVSHNKLCVVPDVSGPPDNSVHRGYDISSDLVQKSLSLNSQKGTEESYDNLKVTDECSVETLAGYSGRADTSQTASSVSDVTSDSDSTLTRNVSIMEFGCEKDPVRVCNRGSVMGNQDCWSCSRNVVYPRCECVAPSWYETMEANLWRWVVLTSHSCMNLGLMRFMDKNLFTFSKDNQQYIFLPELELRGLLDFVKDEGSWVKDLLNTPLLSCELRPMEVEEMEYIEQYLWVQRAVQRGMWCCQMITPCGLHLLFQGLYQCQGNPCWFVPAHSLFYQMKLAHHCRWSLQVTPPIIKEAVDARQKRVVDRVLNVTFYDYGRNQQKVALLPVQDGGAGTSISHHNLSPSLTKALKYCLELFRLDQIAEPFCHCELDVSDALTFRPLNINNVTFPHVTHVHLMGSSEPLHCWKRPNGFYVSVTELIEKSYLPPHNHKMLQVLLAAATMGSDVCIMLELEKMFLDQLKMEETLQSIPCQGGRSKVSKEERQAAIASFLEAQERVEEVYKVNSRKSQEHREDLLINLVYLRKMYQELAKTETVFLAHSQAKFYIKHWPHRCAQEDSINLCLCEGTSESSEGKPEYAVTEEDDSISDIPEQQQELSSHRGDWITHREEGGKMEQETEWCDVEDMTKVQECPSELCLADRKGWYDADSICWKEAKGLRHYMKHKCGNEVQSGCEEKKDMKEQKEEIVDLAVSSSNDESDCDEHQYGVPVHPDVSEGHQTENRAWSVAERSSLSASHEGSRGVDHDLYLPVTPDVEATRLGCTHRITRRGWVAKGQSQYEFQYGKSQERSWLSRDLEDLNTCPNKQEQADTNLTCIPKVQQLYQKDLGFQEGDEALNLPSHTKIKTHVTVSQDSGVHISSIKQEVEELSEKSFVTNSDIQSLPSSHITPSCTQTVSFAHRHTKKQHASCKTLQTQFNGDGGIGIQCSEDSAVQTEIDMLHGIPTQSDFINRHIKKQTTKCRNLMTQYDRHESIQMPCDGESGIQTPLDENNCIQTESDMLNGSWTQLAGPSGNVRRLSGSSGNDRRLSGPSGNDRRLSGPSGNDRRLSGPKGNDRRLSSPSGNDRRLNGPNGNDRRLSGPSGNDRRLNGPSGNDRRVSDSSASSMGMKEREEPHVGSPSELVVFFSFEMEDYPRSCSCPDEINDGILRPFSSVQCFFNSQTGMNNIHSLRHVGQAIIGGHFLFTFTHKEKLYLSLAQLVAVGLVSIHVRLQAYIHYKPIHWIDWIRQVHDEEVAFLRSNGFLVSHKDSSVSTVHSCLVSAEFLCYMSDENTVVKQKLLQKDIYIHRTGHLCPDNASQARCTLESENRKSLELVLQAWSRSASLHELMKDVEQKRMAKKTSTGLDQVSCNSSLTPTPLFQNDSPQKIQPTITSNLCVPKNRTTSQDCAVYLRKIKSSELEMRPHQQSLRFHVSSPTSERFVPAKRKMMTTVKKNKKENKWMWTNIFEGAMLPGLYKKKNLCLKTGVGFCELDTNTIQQWTGDKFSTHHIVLTGTLSITPKGSFPVTFCCFKINDEVYVNWGELSACMVGIETIFSLARHLHVSMYDLPEVMNLHLCRHFESEERIFTKPWLCLNSLNAIGWLGLMDDGCRFVFPKTVNLLTSFFHSTTCWNLQLRNFLLLPKEQHSLPDDAEKWNHSLQPPP